MSRRTPFGSILLLALVLAPRVGRAEGAGAAAAAPPSAARGMAAERQKLRAELDRVNAEIDVLKRERRGLRDDYRLRGRMADAEALARRLTELDAREGSDRRTVPRLADAVWPSAPEARPSDDRADLEAKADILIDQSRRLNRQAEVLAGRMASLRGRQELWRRAGQLERDPFSPLEQPKRRIVTGVASGAEFRAPPPPSQPAGGTTLVSGAGPGSAAPMAGVGAASSPPARGAEAPTAADVATKDTSHVSATGATSAPPATPVGSGLSNDTAGSLASQFRGILDATTLAEIRRLEVLGSSSGNLQAMERALTALRARAGQLAANAGELRTRARTAR
jgi:hypothetical protein